jgi:ABC-type lipoprotein release transport system permease subunit
MTLGRLVLRNVFFHWRGNLAVLLGVAVGTAVLTGALLVGDSLRGSLRQRTLEQLGWVEDAVVAPRFFRAVLADKLQAEHACPVILLRGTASALTPGRTAPRRSAQVTILGVDERFWVGSSAPEGEDFWQSTAEEGVLNATLAGDLGVGPGDTITLNLQKVSAIPRESLLGRRKVGDVVDEVEVRVKAVLPAESLGTRFSLSPSLSTPRNVFLPLRLLQSRLGQEGRVNGLLAAAKQQASRGWRDHLEDWWSGVSPWEPSLQVQLGQRLNLEDWGLVLRDPDSRTRDLFARLDRNRDGRLTPNECRRQLAEAFVRAADKNGDGVLERAEVLDFYTNQRDYLSLESRQMLLEPAAVEAGRLAARDVGLRMAPTLVYLANRISDGKDEIPYSIVAALDPTLPPPLGPLLPPGVDRLADDEILLADWSESPLKAGVGDKITLTYFSPEEQGPPREEQATFRLRGRVPMQGPAADPELTPAFPGITDKLNLRDWDPPFPYDNKRVGPRDEHYWEVYRTTPKAYVTLAAGQRLWASRFGQLTSIRLAALRGLRVDKVAQSYGYRLLSHLRPEQGGLVFEAVRAQGLKAAGEGTDFGLYFLLFSFFLIASALLLVGLLFRLNLDRRADELGVLLAAGYRRATLRRLLLGEGCILAAVGALFGLVGALGYSWLLLELLDAWWPGGGLDRSLLRPHVTPGSLTLGYASALVVSVLTIAWAVRVLGRVEPRALLAGETTAAPAPDVAERRPRWSLGLAVVGLLGAIGLLVFGGRAEDAEARAGSFFGSGALLLTASLALAWAWMRGRRHGHVSGHGLPALARLGVRNAARHPVRSLLTAGLLASATFLVVAVESFHREAEPDVQDPRSGSGGFALVAESEVPVFQDLSTPAGQEQLNLPPAARTALQGVEFISFRLRPGDDASCLNLYRPRRPRVLGVRHALVARGGFHFQASEARSAEERANPWLLLEQPDVGGAIPVIGEANTVEYVLKSGLGRELEVPDARGEPTRLRIVGLLKDSVFQSELLVSEANFLRLYPRQEGYQFFLARGEPDRAGVVRSTLEAALADHGMVVTPTAERLQAYLAVENMYLATFQALGGLGLLLGALGLAVVLLRGVWERRGELALLRALGYRHRALGWLVLAENSFLLVLGLAVGAAAAVLAVAPHRAGSGGELSWPRLFGLLAAVLAVGLVSGTAAVAATLRAPLLPALRRE